MNKEQEVDAFLEHFGIMGMHWGIRNKKKTSLNNKEKKDNNFKRNKRVAIILGSVAAAAAIGTGAYFIKKKMGVSVSETINAPANAKKFAEAIAKEPIDIIHVGPNRNAANAFLQGGGLKSSLHEYEKAGLENMPNNQFKRYGNVNEKIAARFLDPERRIDRAGRPVHHDVILPKSMTKDINNIEDVIKVAWPKLKPLFNAYFIGDPKAHGPGY